MHGDTVLCLPEEAAARVAEHGAPPKPLVALARKALAAIKSKSELKNLWEESETFDDWVRSLVVIEGKLTD